MNESKNWYIYDADGNLVNTVYGTEESIKELCESEGWTYVLAGGPDPDPQPTLTDSQQRLIDDFVSIRTKLMIFYQDHSWARSSETFELAIRQWTAMVDYYKVLHERIQMEGLTEHIPQ